MGDPGRRPGARGGGWVGSPGGRADENAGQAGGCDFHEGHAPSACCSSPELVPAHMPVHFRQFGRKHQLNPARNVITICCNMERQPSTASIAARILLIRGERVMLDSDLAALYGVTTGRPNEQVRRNRRRFPPNFMFQITSSEWDGALSQNAGTSQASRRRDRLPLAFTKRGCLMLSQAFSRARPAQLIATPEATHASITLSQY